MFFFLCVCLLTLKELASGICDTFTKCHTCENKPTQPFTINPQGNQDWLLNSCDCAKQAGNMLFASVGNEPVHSSHDRVFIFLLKVKVLSFWHPHFVMYMLLKYCCIVTE